MADIFELFKKIGSSRPPEPPGPVDSIAVCLGNPGKQYDGTRHNAGFQAADLIAEKRNFKIDRLRFQSLTGECVIEGKRTLFLKPSTFMNLSGTALVEAMNFYKISISRVVVIFDDVSLAPGKLRVRLKGSDGGHNGIKNIIYLTGSDQFMRIKIGVGQKPHPDYDMADWVLSRPAPEDQKLIAGAIEKVDGALADLLAGRSAEAMNRYNC